MYNGYTSHLLFVSFPFQLIVLVLYHRLGSHSSPSPVATRIRYPLLLIARNRVQASASSWDHTRLTSNTQAHAFVPPHPKRPLDTSERFLSDNSMHVPHPLACRVVATLPCSVIVRALAAIEYGR